MTKVMGIIWAFIVAVCAGFAGLGVGTLFQTSPDPVGSGFGAFFAVLAWIIYRRWAEVFLP